MTINLTEVMVKPSLFGPEVKKDLYKEVAEAVYQRACTLEQSRFANRLFESTGEIEIEDKEAQWITEAISGFRFWIQEPILAQMNK